MDKIIMIIDEPHYSFCCYGRPDSPEDYIKECDCEITLEEARDFLQKERIKEIY